MAHAGRSGIKVLLRFQRLENRPNHFSGLNENSRAMPDRLICESSEHSTPNILIFSWVPDPQSLASDAFHQNWGQARNYHFPPFCLIMKTLAKIWGEGGEPVLITPVWPTQAWYPVLLEMLVDPPILLAQFPNLSNPRGELHPLLVNKTLFLAAWLVLNNQSRQRKFQIGLPSLSSHLGDQEQIPFTIQPEISGIPAMPHYQHCWDINKVLEYIKIFYHIKISTIDEPACNTHGYHSPETFLRIKTFGLTLLSKTTRGSCI